MPKTKQCSFCGHEFPPSTGMTFVKNDGSTLVFCSNKCRKSSIDLKRDSRKVKWTKYFGKEEKGRA